MSVGADDGHADSVSDKEYVVVCSVLQHLKELQTFTSIGCHCTFLYDLSNIGVSLRLQETENSVAFSKVQSPVCLFYFGD